MRAMHPQTRIAVRQAWFGTLTADEVAGKYNCASGQVVRNFWKEEKKRRRLPDGPRPHFATVSAAGLPLAAADHWPIDRGIDRDLQRDLDCDPLIIRVPDGDPLLAALRRAHPDGPPPDVRLDDKRGAPTRRQVLALMAGSGAAAKAMA